MKLLVSQNQDKSQYWQVSSTYSSKNIYSGSLYSNWFIGHREDEPIFSFINFSHSYDRTGKRGGIGEHKKCITCMNEMLTHITHVLQNIGELKRIKK